MLLLYTPQMMTETLATFLAAAVLARHVLARDLVPVPAARDRRRLGTGLPVPADVSSRARRCGPCGLPGRASWPSRREAASQPLANALAVERFRQLPWLTLLALGLTIAPWPIRNQVRFGRPIVTTTHGGYTLLLSNNPVYYSEVVLEPWGPSGRRTASIAGKGNRRNGGGRRRLGRDRRRSLVFR